MLLLALSLSCTLLINFADNRTWPPEENMTSPNDSILGLRRDGAQELLQYIMAARLFFMLNSLLKTFYIGAI